MSGLYLGLALDTGRGISQSCHVAPHTASGLLEIMSDARLPTIKGIFICIAWFHLLQDARQGSILEDGAGTKTLCDLKKIPPSSLNPGLPICNMRPGDEMVCRDLPSGPFP